MKTFRGRGRGMVLCKRALQGCREESLDSKGCVGGGAGEPERKPGTKEKEAAGTEV
jgi:hypothetical protein